MDIDMLIEINMKINNLKDMLLSDVDMPDDIAEYYIDKLNDLEVQKSRMNSFE
jgi:hypothetical protein